MKFIVCYSGGHSSALVAIEAVRKHGKENVILLNHDISPEVEHEDIKRFKNEVAAYLGLEITYANMEGWENKTPIRVCRELGGWKFGNSPILCTTKLKTEPFNKYLKENWADKKEEVTILYGFDANEKARIQRRSSILGQQGYKTDYPLAFWERTIEKTEDIGIKRPTVYELHRHGNCFSGDTKFITDKGVKTLKECVGQKVKIITRNGWDSAEIKYFGRQKIVNLTLTNNSRTRVIKCTNNHRWLIPKYNHKSFGLIEKETKDLIIGDIIPINYCIPEIEPDKIGIQHGFIFGDGDLYNVKPTNWKTKSRAYVAVGKEEILKYFDGYKFTKGRRIHGLPKEFKEVPDLNSSKEYLLGFIIGLIASDGCVSKSGIIISHKNQKEVNDITNIIKQLGIIAWNNGTKIRNTNYKENALLSTITIPKKTFKKEWLIREFHKEKFGDKFTEPKSWKIENIEYTETIEDVYCAVVDGELKEFTLDDNILTGNCFGCLKAGMQSWYLVYCLHPEIWKEAVEAEEEIGYSILKDKFLSELEPKFKQMKCRGIVPSEKKGAKKFWSEVEKALPIEGQISWIPCDCSF